MNIQLFAVHFATIYVRVNNTIKSSVFLSITDVQQVLLCALRKRIQSEPVVTPKKKRRRIDINRCQVCKKGFIVGREEECVGCDHCPRWYHKKCCGSPNIRKKWKCNEC